VFFKLHGHVNNIGTQGWTKKMSVETPSQKENCTIVGKPARVIACKHTYM